MILFRHSSATIRTSDSLSSLQRRNISMAMPSNFWNSGDVLLAGSQRGNIRQMSFLTWLFNLLFKWMHNRWKHSSMWFVNQNKEDRTHGRLLWHKMFFLQWQSIAPNMSCLAQNLFTVQQKPNASAEVVCTLLMLPNGKSQISYSHLVDQHTCPRLLLSHFLLNVDYTVEPTSETEPRYFHILSDSGSPCLSLW